jgi:hypothetical protein
MESKEASSFLVEWYLEMEVSAWLRSAVGLALWVLTTNS